MEVNSSKFVNLDPNGRFTEELMGALGFLHKPPYKNGQKKI